MEKRTKLGLLILVALAILGFAIWYLFQPLFKTVQQPPNVPNEVTPTTNLPSTSTQQIPVGGGAAVTVSQDVKALEDLAKKFVVRVGSGSSSDGFTGYDDMLINANASERIKLKSEQSALVTAHPARGPLYGMTTRFISIFTVSAQAGAANMTFRLTTQFNQDAGNPDQPTSVSYRDATVTFERQPDGTYLVSDLVWKDIER